MGADREPDSGPAPGSESDLSRVPLGRNLVRPFSRADDLEGAADEVAFTHAARLSAGGGWFAEHDGLDVGHAKRQVGARLGVDLADVNVRPVPFSAPGRVLATARSRDIEVQPAAFLPRTPVGQALLAHELTHVVQQMPDAALPGGPQEAHGDVSRPVGTAPAGMAQHSISCTSCERESEPAPAPAAPRTTFAEVQRTFRDTDDAAQRTTALDEGIATARANASRLYRNASRPPVSTLRERYEREVAVPKAEGAAIALGNPFIGVSQDHVERAYRAWAENPAASMPPWVLLAVWLKEGLANPAAVNEGATGFSANSEADARAIFRSSLYWENLGADVYIAHTPVPGSENDTDLSAGSGAAHDAAFRAQIARQVKAGRLPRDLSGEIDATISVTDIGGGQYRATASPRFYELSLMLVDAFFREQREALAADPRFGPDPDPGLVYMRWNMRSSSFNAFLNRVPNADPDGSTPSLTDWAFHRPVRENEYGQSRRNAIRFKYMLEIFRYAYEGIP